MKKTIVNFCLFFVLLWQTGVGQSTVPLRKALIKIQQTYGTKFAFEENLLDNINVTLKEPLSKSEPVENVLKDILYKKGFLFLYIQENYYTIIRDNRTDKDTEPQNLPGQHIDPLSPDEKTLYVQTISGKVTDSQGKPLIGATVLPDGFAIRNGVITNSDGQYILRLTQQVEAILVSYVGMVPKKVPVGASDIVNVSLNDNVHMLEEVNVVSTGYQQLPQERATGAFGQVTAQKIKEVPAINLMERLEGQMAGVRFDTRKNTISVRGVNTLIATDASTPLIVIDGFIAMDQDITERANSNATGNFVLSRYNPEDIESITVLKDAAATSIWGAKAANGVIVITTKKGKKNTSNVHFSTNLSLSSPADLKKLNRMSSADYITLEKELKDRGFIADPNVWDSSWMKFNLNKPTSEALEWMFRVDRGTATATQRDSALAVLGAIDNSSQIRKYLMQKAVSQQYNLSLDGGGENNTYYISANYSKDIPVFRSNYGENLFLNANLSNNLFNNRVKLTTGIGYNHNHSKTNQAAVNAIGTSSMGLRPYELLKNSQGNTIQRSYRYTESVMNDFLTKGYLPWTYNPVDELNYSNTVSKEDRIRFIADINTLITDWMNLSASGSFQHKLGEGVILNELNSYSTRDRLNYATSVNTTTGQLIYGIPYGGTMITTNESQTDYSLRGQVNINKSWQNRLSLNLIAGTEIRESQSQGYQQSRFGFDEDTYTSASYNPTVQYPTVEGYTSTIGFSDGSTKRSINRFLSYYSNGALSFLNDRFNLSASVRFDDYSLAGISRKNRAKPLWSTGFKWNIRSEKFMQSQTWLDGLSLRITYGTGGSIPSATSNVALLSISGTDDLTNQPYGSISSPANSRLSWEVTTSRNLGLDMAFLHNRLLVSFDVYTKQTKNILYNFPYNPTYGWSQITYNTASMKGHGYELEVRWTPVQTPDIQWATSFTFSYNTNKVTDSRFTDPAVFTAGGGIPIFNKPTDYLYVYRWAGLDETGQSQIKTREGTIIKSTQGNNLISFADLVYKGRTTPPYFGGLFNAISYKRFSLGVRMSYAMGHIFRKASIDNYPDYITNNYYGVIGNQKDLVNRWQKPGDELKTNVPGLANVNTLSINRYKYSDLLIQSASNIRLQQISLGYTLPVPSGMKSYFKSAELSFAARNLGILWRKNTMGIDPDYINTNNYSNLPPVTSYFLSFTASF